MKRSIVESKSQPPLNGDDEHRCNNCLNCGASLETQFCGQCGQEKYEADSSLAVWLGRNLLAVSRLDTKFLRTAASLTIDPGSMVKKYTQGKRIRFVPPVRYALLTWATWFFGLSLLLAGQANDFATYFLRFGQVGTLLTMPLFAIAIHHIFRPSNIKYHDQVVLLVYWVGHCFLIRAAITACVLLFELQEHVASTIDLCAVLGYLGWALWRFHQGRTNWLPIKVFVGVAFVHLSSKALFLLAAFLFSKLNNV